MASSSSSSTNGSTTDFSLDEIREMLYDYLKDKVNKNWCNSFTTEVSGKRITVEALEDLIDYLIKVARKRMEVATGISYIHGTREVTRQCMTDSLNKDIVYMVGDLRKICETYVDDENRAG